MKAYVCENLYPLGLPGKVYLLEGQTKPEVRVKLQLECMVAINTMARELADTQASDGV